VECEKKHDTSNNRGGWNHFKITQTIPEQHTRKAIIKEVQKTAILGPVHLLRKVQLQKYKTYFMGEITLHVAQTVNTEQLQHYIP